MYKWIYLVGGIIAIILTVLFTVQVISYGRTDAWLYRAKDAGNPAQVAEFLREYKVSLHERNLINGKYYSVWKYPATDMSTYSKIIDGLIDRASALSIQHPTEESYQMGLINLEKDLGDIDARAFSVWFAHGGWLLVISMILLGCLVLVGLMVFFED